MPKISLSKEANKKRRESFMTDEEILRINDYIVDLNLCKGDMSDLYSEWADIEKYYGNNQDDISKRPNSKVNIMNANIEGQAALVAEQEIAVITRGESAGDDEFAEDGRVGIEWTLRKNYFKRPLRMFVRRLLKFGMSAFLVFFDPDAMKKFGLVKIQPISLNCLFVDRHITDILRYQEGDYIARAIPMSRKQNVDVYGEEKADAIDYGMFGFEDTCFEVDSISVMENTSTIIQYWSRENGCLRLEEFTGDGLLLFDSFKGLSRKENQKDKQSSVHSYYKYTDDKYPIFISSLYQREGNFWATGDGKLLLPLQKLINELYDKIRICARPNLAVYDINADMDLDDYDENSLEPRPFDGTNSPDPVKVYSWGTVNENWWRLLMEIYRAAQRTTRFSELMTGQQDKGGENTATEAAIQHQQGNIATDDKKGIIEPTLIEVCEFALGLMMEYYTEGKSFRANKDKKDYRWIDFRRLSKVPVKIPATEEYQKEYIDKNADQDVPKWQYITGSDGMPLTKSVDLDIEINIGAGLPKNKAFITKFLTDMSKAILIDETGMQKPVIYWEEMREFLKKYVGLPIKDLDEIKAMVAPPPMAGQMPGQPGQVPGQMTGQAPQAAPTANMNAQGLGANNGPAMGNLSVIRGG